MLACNSVVILWIAAWSVTWTQAFVEDEIFRNWLDYTGGYVEYDPQWTPQPDFDTNLENQPHFSTHRFLQVSDLQVDNYPVPLAPYPVSLPDPDPRPERQPELASLPDEAPHQARILQESTSEEPSSTLSTDDFSTETSTLSTSDGSTEDGDEDYSKFEPFTESADTNSKNDRSYVKFMEITSIVGSVLVAVISLIILFTIIYVFCPVGKAQGKYTVELGDLSKNNKETLQIYIHREIELEMTDIDLN